jgi:hypothetical protein
MRLRVKVVKFSLIVVLAWVLDYMPTWKESPRGDFDIERRKNSFQLLSLSPYKRHVLGNNKELEPVFLALFLRERIEPY